MSLLGLHLGPAGVEALDVATDGRARAGAGRPVAGHTPRPGWVELAPDDHWRATLEVTREVLDHVAGPTALGVADAPDVLVLWDRETLGTPRPALAATDRRAGASAGSSLVARLRWLAEHEPRTWELVESGDYALGGLASYLLARLTRGTWHVTDVAQAARTGLFDLDTGGWSGPACAAAGVPLDALPEVVATWGVLDRTDPGSFLGLDLPIAGLAAEGVAAGLGSDDLPSAAGAGAPAVAPVAAARGAAYLAGLGTGIWESPEALPAARA